MSRKTREHSDDQVIIGEPFACVLVVCTTIAEICTGGTGSAIVFAALAGTGWMIFCNAN